MTLKATEQTTIDPNPPDGTSSDVLRIAIQKSGRLSDKSVGLLAQCGIRVSNGGKLKAEASNFPLEVLYLRDDDIPQYVADSVADVGILGENVVAEQAREIDIVEHLEFGKCRLALAIRREADYTGTSWFEGKKIATSYPQILSRYLASQGVTAEIETLSGSVEIAPGIGLAEGVCDIVSTGSTLLTNGLKEVETVMHSEAVLVAHPSLAAPQKALLDQLRFRIRAVRNANRNKYILLNAPNDALDEICALLPGMKSPTILPLAESGWSSLHSVVREDEFWEVIDKVKDAGAEGILVCPIEKMVV
jgi:ATP phosphoribosyltransferase